MKRWPRILSWTKLSLLPILAGAGAGIYLYSQQAPSPASVPSPAAESYLIILGAQDKAATVWDGNLKVTGSTVLGMRIWRQAKGDSIKGNNWILSTRKGSSGPNSNGVMAENGVIVTVTPQTTDITFDVGITHRPGVSPVCPQDCFTFHSTQLPFGTPQRFLERRRLCGAHTLVTGADFRPRRGGLSLHGALRR